ncbi:MAG TPA: exopolysaccharide biosynthesis polyprenyl glycosylphosphotransferase [Rhodopila sp.]|nr:exopolysaccharide biosynthesis polyprenyl glycosylphosphotransferase [Rhodopila sp.]
MSAIAHRMPPETAVLGLLEGILSFAAICTVILPGHPNVAVATTAATVTGSIALALGITILLGAFALTAGMYRPHPAQRPVRLVSAESAALVCFGFVLFFLCAELTSPAGRELVLASQLLGGWGLAVMTARALHGLTLRYRPLARRVLLVGDAADTGALLDRLSGLPGYRFECVTTSWQDWVSDALAQRRVWAVVAASSVGQATDPRLHRGVRGVRVLTAAGFQERYLGQIDLDALVRSDLLDSRGFAAGSLSAALKRTSDLTFSVGLLFATLPVMILTAIAIKLDSPGPVLYTQQRIGQFGRPFTVLKFRSMTVDAEAGGAPRWAQKHDPRVTRVGRLIRTTRIDELPQLLNIIRGDMSLVGPRPERPHFVEELCRAIPFYRERHCAKPGLTGWAQVNYPYGASVEDAREKLAYDLYYIKNRSFLLDLFILCATVRVVLSGEGAR